MYNLYIYSIYYNVYFNGVRREKRVIVAAATIIIIQMSTNFPPSIYMVYFLLSTTLFVEMLILQCLKFNFPLHQNRIHLVVIARFVR